MTFDSLTPAQRNAVEQLVREANARHKQRCKGKTRPEITKLHEQLAEELRDAYTEGMKAREERTDANLAGV